MCAQNLPVHQEGYKKGRKSADTIDINPKKICFSQTTIDSKFKDGRLLPETLQETLKSNDPEKFIRDNIPPIEVKGLQSTQPVVITGNRRLFLYKLLARNDIIQYVAVKGAKGQKTKSRSVCNKDIHCPIEATLKKIVQEYRKEQIKEDKENVDARKENMGSTPNTSGARQALRDKTNDAQVETPKMKSAKKRSHQADDKENQATMRGYSRKRKSPELTPETKRDPSKLATATIPKENPKRCSKRLASKDQPSVFVTEHGSTTNEPEQEENEPEESPKRLRLTPSPDLQLESATTGASQEMDELWLTN